MHAEEFHRHSTILAGKDVLAHELPQIRLPSQQPLLDRLRRPHRATIDLSEIAQEVIGHTNAATGLQQHLVEAAFDALAHADDQISVPGHRHQGIMARFEALIEANPDRALFMAEVCEAIGVAARTSRTTICRCDGYTSPLGAANGHGPGGRDRVRSAPADARAV